MLLLKLPPSDRIKTFEKLDFLTFGLFAPGVALLCAVLSLGRIVWWLETPWIGVALAGAIALITSELVIEHESGRKWGGWVRLLLGQIDGTILLPRATLRGWNAHRYRGQNRRQTRSHPCCDDRKRSR
ncbi:hypothetical protein ACFS07_17740 [Undibacterium arcticum]